MACRSCQKAKKLKVVTASGRVVYRTNDRVAAERIQRSYPGSEIKEKDEQS